MNTIQDVIDWLRDKLREWLGPSESEIKWLHTHMDDLEKIVLETTSNLQKRMDELETAYAADPRRAEIAKKEAEQPNHIAGFTPRSKRISAWEGQRKAEPKK